MPSSTRLCDLAPCGIQRPNGVMRRILVVRDNTVTDRDCACFPIGRCKSWILLSKFDQLTERGEGEGGSAASDCASSKSMRCQKCLRCFSLVLRIVPLRPEATDPSDKPGGLGERLPTMMAQIGKDGTHDRAR